MPFLRDLEQFSMPLLSDLEQFSYTGKPHLAHPYMG